MNRSSHEIGALAAALAKAQAEIENPSKSLTAAKAISTACASAMESWFLSGRERCAHPVSDAVSQAFRSRADELESLDRMLALAEARRDKALRCVADPSAWPRPCDARLPHLVGPSRYETRRVHAETAPSSLTQGE